MRIEGWEAPPEPNLAYSFQIFSMVVWAAGPRCVLGLFFCGDWVPNDSKLERRQLLWLPTVQGCAAVSLRSTFSGEALSISLSRDISSHPPLSRSLYLSLSVSLLSLSIWYSNCPSLLQGRTGGLFLMSQVPLYLSSESTFPFGLNAAGPLGSSLWGQVP